ncbi:MAG: DUF4357 domain-containing protein [Sphaerochaetaceae bacterium]|nr:DUF4357 domain-containing protein [Sphaerochaetaceae bacterium]
MEKQRQTALRNGDIVRCADGTYKLTISIPLTAPSSAAMFVLGGNANGRKEWKDADGKTLDELFRK